ncbi:MAG: hypothetical protein H0W33_02600 [Gammaproteobacteria bacterium]|nr:hypothetical protein [Gammaproteobacteria bacterium]
MGGLLGLTIGEVRDLGLTELTRWGRYWAEEPWGPWRDNLHAAIVSRELRRLLMRRGGGRGGRTVDLDQFMLRLPSARKTERAAGFLGWLRTVGRKQGKHSD